MLKQSIEDVAFSLWDGKQAADEFARAFLDAYPGFAMEWGIFSLAKALEKRL